MTKAVTYIEIDIDYCSLVYSVAPCTAVLGVTGTRPCFNSLSTCQDRNNFTNVPVTLRWAIAADYLPEDIEAIPSLLDVSITPATISLGENLGQRGTLTATFEDHRWGDAAPGFDKYLADRAYDPFRQGTFWGKFRARQPYLRGRPLRLIRGELGQALADMETRHYVIESFDGPTPDGKYSIIAKDVLKLADNDRAQAPLPSEGFLVADINSAVTAATLSPSGIGNLTYPASGYLAIGGKEIVAFTRAADVLTITRGQLGTEAVEHDAQDRCQVVLVYSGIDPADIIAELLEDYAGVDPAFIPLAAWQAETDTHLRRVYTAVIPEPTGVNTLVSELVEQAALALWWDDLAQSIRLQVLRPVPSDAGRWTEDNVMEGSLSIREQPEKRISQVMTYYGPINPLRPVDDKDNYRSALRTVDLESEADYGSAAIKTIMSRWIGQFGLSIAQRLNNLLIGRFKDPPRRFGWDVFRGGSDVSLGTGYGVESWAIQDDTGAPSFAPVQVTRLAPRDDRYSVEAEEMLFTVLDEEDSTDRIITIDADANNLNIRTIHDGIYGAATDADVLAGVTLTVVIADGVTVGSTSTATPALDVGSWPVGFPVTITGPASGLGRIQGKGGDGGPGGEEPASNGKVGGPALYARDDVNLDDSALQIWGGAGGGGGGGPVFGWFGGGGGGGAGTQGGAGGAAGGSGASAGGTGTATSPGVGGGASGGAFDGAAGGSPGVAGGDAAGGDSGNGGAPGAAIDGISYVTTIGTPHDRRGPEIN